MDADLIISTVALAIVVPMGVNTWLLLTLSDLIGKADRRIEGQNQRLTKVIEWAEGPKPARKNAK